MKVHATEIGGFFVPAHDAYFSHAELIARHQGAAANALAKAVEYLAAPPHEGVAVDIGAHIGTWTVPLAQAFDVVIAFEPHPQNFLLLWKNTSGFENVRPFQMAIGPSLTRVAVHYDAPERAEELTACGWCKKANGDLKVPWAMCVPLDSLELPRLDLLKIDAEGLEYAILEGARETIQRHRPVIVYEDNRLAVRYDGHQRGDVAGLLSSWGYREVGRVNFMPPDQNDIIAAWQQ